MSNRSKRISTTTSVSSGAGGEDRERVVLVVGDDRVGLSAIRRLAGAGTVVFIGMSDLLADRAGEHAQETVEVCSITEFIEETDTRPSVAIVATSQDSRNLLIAQHLRLEFDMEDITVRVNDPQNTDAFAELAMEIVDVADIVGSELVRRLGDHRSS